MLEFIQPCFKRVSSISRHNDCLYSCGSCLLKIWRFCTHFTSYVIKCLFFSAGLTYCIFEPLCTIQVTYNELLMLRPFKSWSRVHEITWSW